MATRLGTGTSGGGPTWLRVAIVAYQGVLADESWAFRDVFARVPGARVLTVGHRLGVVGGPGGAQHIEATFDERRAPPTSSSCPAGSAPTATRRSAPGCGALQPRWVLTSSTGSALLAASGLLRGRTAATHWLAGPLLERHGVVVSRRPRGRRPALRHVRRAGQRPTTRRSSSSAAVGGPVLVRDIRRAAGRGPRARRRRAPPRPAHRPPAPASPADGGRRGRAGGDHAAAPSVTPATTGPHAAGRRGIIAAMGSSTTPDERWASNVVLGDGETVHIRPIRPDDAPALAAFHERQSPESIYRRYFSPRPRLSDADLEHFTNVDMVDRVALVVERYGEFIAWASYERWPGATTPTPRSWSTTSTTARASPRCSSSTSRRSPAPTASPASPPRCWPTTGRCWPCSAGPGGRSSGASRAASSTSTSPLDETEEFLDSVERREQRADSRAVARLLLPRTIAVVGASDTPGLGRQGAVAPRHGRRDRRRVPRQPAPRHGRRAPAPGRRCSAIPADVSLAVVAVPAAALPAVDRRLHRVARARRRHRHVRRGHRHRRRRARRARPQLRRPPDRPRQHGHRLVAGVDRPAGLARPGHAAARQRGHLPAVRVARRLACCASPTSCASGCRGSCRSATRATSRATTCCSSGRTTRRRGSSPCTPSRSATRASSPASPGACRSTGRSSPCASGAAAIGPSGGALYQHAGLIEVPTVAAMLDTARVLATQPVMRGPRVAVLANARSPETLSRAALTTAGLIPVDAPVALDWRSTPAEYGAAVRAALDGRRRRRA